MLFTLELQRRKNDIKSGASSIIIYLEVAARNRTQQSYFFVDDVTFRDCFQTPIVVKRQLIRKSDDCSICPNSNEFNGDFIDFFSKSLNSVSIESYLIADKENLANSFHNYLTEKTESNK